MNLRKMKSSHFEILPKGIIFITSWLFRIKLFSELTFIIIYPFVFVKNKRLKTNNNFDLECNQMMIMIRQAEEIFQVSIVLFIISGLIDHLWIISLSAFLLYPLLYIYYYFPFRKKLKISKGFAKHKISYYLAWYMTDTPMYTEAYSNCNFPQYLDKRNIFAWWKYR